MRMVELLMNKYIKQFSPAVLSVFLICPQSLAKEPNLSANQEPKMFTRQTAVEEVISEPLFSGFGRLIFPLNSGYYSGRTLEEVRLTWYSNVNADKTVEIVNTLKTQTKADNRVFFDIYTEDEKKADPQKRNTGLFFFRGKKQERFAICNAGGGFAFVGAIHDSFPHALEISKKGLNAFVLIYRPGWQTAMEDLGRAITFIYDNAEALGVSTDGYSLWGGSAGARMAATLGNRDYLRYYTGRTDIPKADAVIMQYTGYSDVSQNDAPTYACVGSSDGIADWRVMQNRLQELSSYGIATEFHVYKGLPHGFGLGTNTVAEGWIEDAVNFWLEQKH